MPPVTLIHPQAHGPAVLTAGSIVGLLGLALMLTIAVFTELKAGRIPNWLTLSGMSLGLLLGYLNGKVIFLSSVGGLAIGFGFMLIFYLFKGAGGGDVKLMGAVGALMGVNLIKPTLFYTTFIGAFLAVMMVIWRRDFWLRMTQGCQRLRFWRKANPEKTIPLPAVTMPYGIAIATGCVLALFMKGSH